jgi:hypothetical protein
VGRFDPPTVTRYSERVGRAVLALRAAERSASPHAASCGRCGHIDTLNVRAAEALLLAAIREELAEGELSERVA